MIAGANELWLLHEVLYNTKLYTHIVFQLAFSLSMSNLDLNVHSNKINQ